VTNKAALDPLAGNIVSSSQVTGILSTLGTQTCTQITTGQCSTASLTTIIKTVGGMKVAYCTNKYLVLMSSGAPNHLDGLKYIPHPPGSGTGAYSSSNVTRSWHQQLSVFKIPLFPVDLGVSSPLNNMAAFAGQTDPSAFTGMYGLPTSGAVGVTVTGSPIFPLFNNAGSISHVQCELDKCSAHAGQGFDYHYHGDPFSNTKGKCMYSPADYPDPVLGHPPQIGKLLNC